MSQAEVVAWMRARPVQLCLSPDTKNHDTRASAAVRRFKITLPRALAALEEART